MKNINLIEMVQEVLDSGETAYSLSKKSGISEQLIGKYRNGITAVGNMTIENAQKLIIYAFLGLLPGVLRRHEQHLDYHAL